MADEKDFEEVSLDTTLDDIEDLPSFAVFPTGSYLVTLEKGLEHKPDQKAISANMTLIEVVELDKKNLDKTEEPPKTGDICSLFFKLDNPIGAGKLKQFLAAFKESFGEQSIRGYIESSRGLQLLVVLTRSFDREKGRHFQNFTNVAIT